MEWIKAAVNTTSQGADIIASMLLDLGIPGVEIIDKSEMAEFFDRSSSQWDYIDDALRPALDEWEKTASVIFYLGTDRESMALLKQINMELEALKARLASSDSLGSLALSVETANDQDWLHEWKKYFQPIRIGKVLIVPEWDQDNHKSDIVFTIDPGSAFGTGQHATTALCIEALQEYIRPGSTVLDIGCGSGILSIISLLLGAKQVVGCDIDPTAVEVAKKNAALNPINQSSLQVYSGDVLENTELQAKIGQTKYDIVIANIVADVIIRLSPLVGNLLKPKGLFIASGIITERLDDVKASLAVNRYSLLEVKQAEGWCCVVANG